MTPPFPVSIRPAEATDLGFIVGGWLESYHAGNAPMRAVRFGRYKPPMRRLIHDILGRSTVLVACDPEAPDHLEGFVVGAMAGSVPVLHYVYVKQTRRKYGLAQMLSAAALEKLGVERWWEHSHTTYVGTRIADAKGIAFNPFLAYPETP
jgi:hypothetical protein